MSEKQGYSGHQPQPAYPVQGQMHPSYPAGYPQPGPAYAPPPAGYAPPPAGYAPPPAGYAPPPAGYAPQQAGYAPPQQQVVYQQGQPQVQTTYPVVIHAAPRPPTPMSPTYKKSFIGLGAVQITMGLICIVINSIGQGMSLEAFYVGAGYWCGGMFIMTGAFGVVSGKKEHKGFVITFLVFSIIMALIFSWGIVGQASAGIGHMSDCRYYDYYGYHGYYPCYERSATLTLNSLLLIGGFVELVSAIVSAAYCCGALCCQKRQPGQVQYIAAGHQMVAPGQQIQYQTGQQIQYQTVPGVAPPAQPPMNPQYPAAGMQAPQQPGVQPAPGPTPDAPPAYSQHAHVNKL